MQPLAAHGGIMKKAIATDQAPAAIGPYSQAIISGDFLFCSGQIALDPEKGEPVGSTAAEQCEQVMKNLGGVLKAAGLDYSNIIKTTLYLANIDDFVAVNEVYGKFFENDPPARAAVAVAALPKGALVMIDAIAAVKEG